MTQSNPDWVKAFLPCSTQQGCQQLAPADSGSVPEHGAHPRTRKPFLTTCGRMFWPPKLVSAFRNLNIRPSLLKLTVCYNCPTIFYIYYNPRPLGLCVNTFTFIIFLTIPFDICPRIMCKYVIVVIILIAAWYRYPGFGYMWSDFQGMKNRCDIMVH